MSTGDFIIKICGITNREDALASVEFGANVLGFNFYQPSPRFTDPQEVESLLEQLPRTVWKVAVVVVSPSDVQQTVEDIIRFVPSIDAFQLHGLKSESEVPSTEKHLYLATSPVEAKAFANHDIIIDTSWGRGQRSDWGQVASLKQSFILSGGLDPENVVEAIQSLHPAGVDVCSGVEQTPGLKDHEKLRRFIEGAKSAVRALRTGEKHGQ
ncbi:MAG: phosphoribosylanthranilate isomerase [Acidobacteriota bacterium]